MGRSGKMGTLREVGKSDIFCDFSVSLKLLQSKCFKKLFTDFIERGEICFSTYLCIHWLILVCALTGDRTHNLGMWRCCSKQLSYLARAQ